MLAAVILAPLLAVWLMVWLQVSLSAGPWRDRIAQSASEALGRKVTLEGPLEMALSLRPVLRVGGIRIASPPGFSNPEFAYLGEARLQVDLMGLLRNELRVRELSAENVRAQLERAADGRVSWAFDLKPRPAQPAQPSTATDLSSV